MPVPGDNPIISSSEDLLDRSGFASTIATEIASLDVRRGYTVGILGPWGSGKSSLVNLVSEILASETKVERLDFNPWMFSGSDQLVDSFFKELASQLRQRSDRFDSLASNLEAYGEVLAPLRYLPVIGTWIERFRGSTQALGRIAEKRRPGIAQRKADISEALAKVDHPFMVIIDDIDRLQTEEIRDIFKLVRLTGSFPNIIYVLVFDRHRVELALTDDGLNGRHYLEKILQITYDVPRIPEALLAKRITNALDEALADIEPLGPFSSERWPDVFFEIVRPLIRNMRDVRRYVGSLVGTLRSLKGDIEVVDVLGLEAIRVFDPDLFGAIGESVDVLTETRSGTLGSMSVDDTAAKEQIGLLVGVAEQGHQSVAEATIRRLFPAAGRHLGGSNYDSNWSQVWLKNRLVANRDVLAFYFERIANSGLAAFSLAEKAFSVLADEDALAQILSSLDAVKLEETISALEVFQDEYPPDAVRPAMAVLLNQMPRLNAEAQGMFGFGADIVVTRVVLRLLRRLATESEIEDAVEAVFPRIETLWAKFELLLLVGHVENAGSKIVSEAHAKKMELELRDAVRAATADQIAIERHPLNLLSWVKTSADGGEPSVALGENLALDRALLLDATSRVRSRPMGNRGSTIKVRLNWNLLVDVVGGASEAAAMVERLRASPEDDPEIQELLDLAQLYIDGNPPSDSPFAGLGS